jgi:hypothetical protein
MNLTPCLVLGAEGPVCRFHLRNWRRTSGRSAAHRQGRRHAGSVVGSLLRQRIF